MLDIREGAPDLLDDRDVVEVAVLREVRGAERDLSAAREPGQGPVWQLDGGAPLGVGLDAVPGLHDLARLGLGVRAPAACYRRRLEEDGQGRDCVGGG